MNYSLGNYETMLMRQVFNTPLRCSKKLIILFYLLNAAFLTHRNQLKGKHLRELKRKLDYAVEIIES